MLITLDDISITITDLDEDKPIIPKRLGLCSNFIGAFDTCGRLILDDDIEYVELPVKNNRRQFICGSCCNRLLSPKSVILESDQPEKVKSHKKGRTGARLPQGEDL